MSYEGIRVMMGVNRSSGYLPFPYPYIQGIVQEIEKYDIVDVVKVTLVVHT